MTLVIRGNKVVCCKGNTNASELEKWKTDFSLFGELFEAFDVADQNILVHKDLDGQGRLLLLSHRSMQQTQRGCMLQIRCFSPPPPPLPKCRGIIPTSLPFMCEGRERQGKAIDSPARSTVQGVSSWHMGHRAGSLDGPTLSSAWLLLMVPRAPSLSLRRPICRSFKRTLSGVSEVPCHQHLRLVTPHHTLAPLKNHGLPSAAKNDTWLPTCFFLLNYLAELHPENMCN